MSLATSLVLRAVRGRDLVSLGVALAVSSCQGATRSRQPTPREPRPQSDAVETPMFRHLGVASLHSLVCVSETGGAVWCAWATPQRPTLPPPFVRIDGVDGSRGVAVSQYEICGLSTLGITCRRFLQDREALAPVRAAGAAVDISGNAADRTCALGAAGGLTCWGNDESARISSGVSLERGWLLNHAVVGWTEQPASVASDVQTWCDSSRQMCIVHRDGSIICGGQNAFGEVSDGVTVDRGFRRVPLDTPASACSTGAHLSCAVTQRGVYCWGQLPGTNCAFGDCLWPEVSVSEIAPCVSGCRGSRPRLVLENDPADPFVEVDGGWEEACARTRGGTLWCWSTRENRPPAVVAANVTLMSVDDHARCHVEAGDILNCLRFGAISPVPTSTSVTLGDLLSSETPSR